jgi:Kef-type K+ transport system membrane component KefB
MGACGVVAPVLLSLAAVYLVLPTEDTAVMPSGFVVADGDLWTVGLAMGASLAPTSMGFSATMLKEYHQDKHAWAQLVLVAAIVDDVLSLFLLSMVSQISLNTGGGNSGGGLDGFDVSYVLYPLLALLILSVLAQQNNSRKWVSGVSTRPSMTPGVVHGCMLFAAFWLAWCSEWLGLSPLVGCFYAGLLFAQLDAEWIQKHWDVPVKPYLCWGTRLFFGATIPFAIPSIYADDGMLNGKPFGVGLLLTLVAVGGKMLTGVCIREERTWPAMLRTGIAMQGRGEISFLVATTARYQGLLTTTLYGGIVWALLIINCAAPLVLRYVLSTGGADALADANADANADAMTPRRSGGEEKTQEMEVRSRDADISKHLNLPTEHPLPPAPPFVSLYDK